MVDGCRHRFHVKLEMVPKQRGIFMSIQETINQHHARLPENLQAEILDLSCS